MMENDDKLIASFFADHRQEIADNGFTRRVMRCLPDNSRRLSQIWTTFCFTLALMLFIAFDGLKLVLDTLRETFNTFLQSGVAEVDHKSLLIAAVVLIILGWKKISSLA